MLHHTFSHLPGVALRTEQRLWAAGVTTWADALAWAESSGRLPGKVQVADLHESMRRREAGDARWFAGRLPARDSWRLFAEYRHQCAYLDIETTGASTSDAVTTIALYDGQKVRTYVRGENLCDFARDVREYQLLVTYNGKCFDLPVLRHCLGCPLDQAHVDLRYPLASLGLRGGLKAVERQVGVARPGLEEVDGSLAVLLWYDYQRRKDRRSLETLLSYNVLDAVNLERLMVHAHNALLGRLGAPFEAARRLPEAPAVTNPFAPDPEAVRRALNLRDRYLYLG